MPPFSLRPLSGRYLSFVEREEIAVRQACGCGVREIARQLRRSSSTISRELRRNAATRSGNLEYRATTARRSASEASESCQTRCERRLRQYVQDRLGGLIAAPDGAAVPGPNVRWVGRRLADRRWAASWSPEQIANRLRVDFPDIARSHLPGALRSGTRCAASGADGVPSDGTRATGARARACGRGKTFVRPERGGRPRRSWALGRRSSAIGTLVERTSRFTMLLHLPRLHRHDEPRTKNGPALAGHGAEAVRDAIASSITTLPEQLRRSLTWDQGAEMAQHAQLRIDTGLAVYFSRARGSAARTKTPTASTSPKALLSKHTLTIFAAALNSRPRKTLGWKTPAETLEDLLHR